MLVGRVPVSSKPAPILDVLKLREAYEQAAGKLRNSPGPDEDAFLRFILERLRPQSPKVIANGLLMISELGHDNYDIRESAQAQLIKQFAVFRPIIMAAVRAPASIEAGLRLERIVDKCRMHSDIPAGVEVLQLLKNPEYLKRLLEMAEQESVRQMLHRRLSTLLNARQGGRPATPIAQP